MKNIPDITVLQHLERGSPHIKFRDTVQPPLYKDGRSDHRISALYYYPSDQYSHYKTPPPLSETEGRNIFVFCPSKRLSPSIVPYPDESELILINRIRSMMGKTFLSAQLLDHNIPCFPGNVEREIQ